MQECLSPKTVIDGEGGKEEVEVVEVVEEVVPPPPLPPPPRPVVDPVVLEGLYVVNAHMTSNKIALVQELLTGLGRRGTGFTYAGLRDSLHAMAVDGATDRTFYIGDAGGNGRAYGLINLVAFLATSAQESILHGGCGEVNSDAVGGVLQLSNVCGQHGRNYQDQGECPEFACAVDPTLRVEGGEVVRGDWWDGAAGDHAVGAGYVPPPPFVCGPKSDYDRNTGHWDYVGGTEVEGMTKNTLGKDHVEGCCWWGRGAVQIRGACAYVKLSYHLGQRAHEEGWLALYPDVDFCRDPQAICSSARYPNLRWTAGLFRWITKVQTYQRGGFGYMQELIMFVDGGMQDWTFAHGAAGIVTQGCHKPPCVEGTEFDGANHMATFRKTLKLFGLSTGDRTGAG